MANRSSFFDILLQLVPISLPMLQNVFTKTDPVFNNKLALFLCAPTVSFYLWNLRLTTAWGQSFVERKPSFPLAKDMGRPMLRPGSVSCGISVHLPTKQLVLTYANFLGNLPLTFPPCCVSENVRSISCQLWRKSFRNRAPLQRWQVSWCRLASNRSWQQRKFYSFCPQRKQQQRQVCWLSHTPGIHPILYLL